MHEGWVGARICQVVVGLHDMVVLLAEHIYFDKLKWNIVNILFSFRNKWNKYFCTYEEEEEQVDNHSIVIHCLWYSMVCTLFAKGLKQIHRGLQMTNMLIINVILYVNANEFLKWKYLQYDI